MIYLELCIVNRSEEISKVVEAVESFGQANGIPRNVINDMNLSLDEVLSNIISYAWAADTVRTIAVRLAIADRQFIANIDDDGRPFNPLTAPTPNLSEPAENRTIGGLGIRFVKALMDDVAYVRRGDCNCLELKKNLDSV